MDHIIDEAVAAVRKKVYARSLGDDRNQCYGQCGLEAKTDYIVSRDSHLRYLKHFHGTQMVDVTTFIKKVREK
jgi:predicted nucleic acid-binding protein